MFIPRERAVLQIYLSVLCFKDFPGLQKGSILKFLSFVVVGVCVCVCVWVVNDQKSAQNLFSETHNTAGRKGPASQQTTAECYNLLV